MQELLCFCFALTIAAIRVDHSRLEVMPPSGKRRALRDLETSVAVIGQSKRRA